MAKRDGTTEISRELDGLDHARWQPQTRATRALNALLVTGVLLGCSCRSAGTQALEPAAPDGQPDSAPTTEPELALQADSTDGDEQASDTQAESGVDSSTDSSATDAASQAKASQARHAIRRAQLAQTLAREPAWNLYESEHYFLASPLVDPLLIEGAKRRLDALRRQLEQDFPPNGAPAASPTLVRILPDRAAFVDWGGQAGSSAFWLSEQQTLVCYDAGDRLERERETWPALQHVLVHEYFGQVLGIREVPPWLLYGVATKYAGLQLKGVGVNEHWTSPAAATLDDPLREVLAGEGPMPLARLLAFDSQEFLGVNEFGSTAYRNLILAGGFVRFTENTELDQAALPADFLGRYASALQAGRPAAEALSEALQDADLKTIESDWRTWMEARTGRALLSAGG